MSDDLIVFNTEDSVKQERVEAQQYKIFELVDETDPILRKVIPDFDFSNPPVNPNEFASSLVETCRHYKGYGLSANQCGFEYRVFVVGAEDEYVAFFNPKLISQSGEIHMTEGCLSFPFLTLNITRARDINVEYNDFNGVLRQTKLIGISARCFLHELDHLNGVVYTDVAKSLALKNGLKKREKLMKKMIIVEK